MNDIVYVVLSETGEYSDRIVWVSGVYRTEAEAQEAITARLATRRAHDEWNVAHQRELQRLGYDWTMKGTDILTGYSDKRRAEAASKLPPEPPYESAERCEIIRATIGEWVCG